MHHLDFAYRHPLSVALQGSGGLGAFGWGLLDQLLRSERLMLDTLCAANSGALNAVLVADGLAGGGPREAIEKLDGFWQRYPRLPAQDPDALAALLADSVDFERLRRAAPVQLLLSATRVRDGQERIFRRHEISLPAVLACLAQPLAQAPVRVDGELYWDGGHGISLPLRQLVMEGRADDVLLLQQGPQAYEDLPPAGPALLRRLGRLGLGAALQREVDAIVEMADICRSAGLSHSRRSRKLQRLRLHPLSTGPLLPSLLDEAEPRLDWPLVAQLREQGRQAARQWLARQPGGAAGAAGAMRPVLLGALA